MDVYLPKNRTANSRIILYLHRGGWYLGDKGEIKDGAVFFQQQGFVFISLNYRLTRIPENFIHPAQMIDIGMALDLIGAKSSEWNISDRRIALFGGSADAHLSLLYAYQYDPAKRVKAVIPISRPTDLTNPILIGNRMGNEPVGGMIESYIGGKLATNMTAWQAASPINAISANAPPTLFIHGTADSVVPYQQSVAAHSKLIRAGVAAQLAPQPNVGHDLVEAWGALIPMIITFVNTHAK